MKNINIIGCGKLGKTIGKLFVMNNTANILGIVNSTYKSSVEAAEFVGQGIPLPSLSNLSAADVFFITTPDDSIESICQQLVAENKLTKNNLIVHCSGALSSGILQIAKDQQCLIASIHPVKSFADPNEAVTSFKNTLCAFEGDEAALPIITDLFTAIGAKIFKINPHEKSRYHAALVMANNYVVSLSYQAMQNLIAAGVDEVIAKNLVSNLVCDANNNLKDLPSQHALTGPIQRGDITTIAAHLSALQNDPVSKQIYSALGIATLSLTSHSDEISKKILALLDTSK